jgi:hypothetical protein
MIEGPTIKDPKLLEVPANSIKPWGAAPYDGPKRPAR